MLNKVGRLTLGVGLAWERGPGKTEAEKCAELPGGERAE